MLWGVNPGINQLLSPLVPPHHPTLLRVKVKTERYTTRLASPALEEATGPEAASVTMATFSFVSLDPELPPRLATGIQVRQLHDGARRKRRKRKNKTA